MKQTILDACRFTIYLFYKKSLNLSTKTEELIAFTPGAIQLPLLLEEFQPQFIVMSHVNTESRPDDMFIEKLSLRD